MGFPRQEYWSGLPLPSARDHSNKEKIPYVKPVSPALADSLPLSHPENKVQLCDSMDCSLPGSFIHGISQARKLEWVVIRLKICLD